MTDKDLEDGEKVYRNENPAAREAYMLRKKKREDGKIGKAAPFGQINARGGGGIVVIL